MENKFVIREKDIIEFWRKDKTFNASLKQTVKSDIFSFFDGPPFATGLPHYGHLAAGLMKDVVPRYQTMKGRYVVRRWGWDCHGLPVENLCEKEMGLKSKKDIEDIGVDKFNDSCRGIVLRYVSEWRKTVERMGRWVDMDDDYKTMDAWYMESIWWVFKRLWEKELIYQGYKSMHICPRCDTTLSNFEVTQNYKDITDLSVIAKFELVDELGTFILAWTTTPWTLPGNVALAVGQDIGYVKVSHGDHRYILAQENVERIFENKEYKIIEKIKSKDLVGKKYKPLFDYYQAVDLENKDNIYTIQTADFVNVEDGTGVVHIAPGFGEDDMNLGQEKELPMIKHVGPDGRFVGEVKDFAGELVKPKDSPQAMDKKIVQYLADHNLVFSSQEFTHSYPLCWRCDTPLLNYATSSWFVKVTAIKKDLIKNNNKINWVPSHLKAGRFGRWLDDAKDWAISRSRYWGAPLPVWQCKCGETTVAGSLSELEKLSGQKITDLHKHIVDEIKIKCQKCQGEMNRVPEVLDCWFESGSMPYAQRHFPFEPGDDPKNPPQNFPAQFIAEGIDQTRGWFYTLLVLSTALFNKPAYLNVIANGIVLAQDGAKMAKRLRNYPDPEEIMEKYGADALRYYLLSSPVMEGENLNFSEQGVKEVMQKVIMLLDNIFSFYQLYAKNDLKITSVPDSANGLDRWIVAKLQVLIKEITESMDSYYLVKAVRPIQEFINELSTWYVRRSRDRFKSGDTAAVTTLGYILQELSKAMAPFTPFVAEYIYKNLGFSESVHLADWPEFDKKLINAKLLEQMNLSRQIVERGLSARAEAGIKVRQPLASYTTSLAKDLPAELGDIIKEELNIKELKFGPDNLDIILTSDLEAEGLARELIRNINQLRKNAGLTVADQVEVYYQGLSEVFEKFGDEIKKATAASKILEQKTDDMKEVADGEIGIKKI